MHDRAIALLIRVWCAGLVCGLIIFGLLFLLWASKAHARDPDGRYADSPLKPWFNGLKSGNGLCCSFADGVRLTDVQWDTKDGHYRVYLDDHWIDIPDRAVVQEPNRAGVAIVWPDLYNGKVYSIRCFIPGAGT